MKMENFQIVFIDWLQLSIDQYSSKKWTILIIYGKTFFYHKLWFFIIIFYFYNFFANQFRVFDISSLSLKYQKFYTIWFKDIFLRNLEFAAKTQFNIRYLKNVSFVINRSILKILNSNAQVGFRNIQINMLFKTLIYIFTGCICSLLLS